jgi:hypothetical protein
MFLSRKNWTCWADVMPATSGSEPVSQRSPKYTPRVVKSLYFHKLNPCGSTRVSTAFFHNSFHKSIHKSFHKFFDFYCEKTVEKNLWKLSWKTLWEILVVSQGFPQEFPQVI